MAEEFVWKSPKDIWKGVGIYHVTFVVEGRIGSFEGSSQAPQNPTENLWGENPN